MILFLHHSAGHHHLENGNMYYIHSQPPPTIILFLLPLRMLRSPTWAEKQSHPHQNAIALAPRSGLYKSGLARRGCLRDIVGKKKRRKPTDDTIPTAGTFLINRTSGSVYGTAALSVYTPHVTLSPKKLPQPPCRTLYA